jgi:YfiH family protein
MTIITPDWPAPKNVRSMITTKTTVPQQIGAHLETPYRQALIETLRLPHEPIWLTQIHSNQAIIASELHRDQEADASIAFDANQIAVVFTADCLPLLICNQAGTKVAAIHAGWRGLVGGIITNSFNLLRERPNNLLVYLGPAIGPEHFEVGALVYDAFIAKTIENQRAFVPTDNGKYMANIYTLAAIELSALGVKEQQIYGGMHCTYSEQELFYSYRRDNKVTGRLASLIWFE